MDDSVKRYGRTAPTEPANGPTDDPTAAELAALRQEKADREKAERDAKDAELEELRQFKAAKEKEPAVKAPVKKADKPEVKDDAPVTPPPAKRRGLWWSDSE